MRLAGPEEVTPQEKAFAVLLEENPALHFQLTILFNGYRAIASIENSDSADFSISIARKDQALARMGIPIFKTPEEFTSFYEENRNKTSKKKGHGWIFIPIASWTDLGSPVTSKDWHTSLLLPENYEVVDAFRKVVDVSPRCNDVNILVSSEEIQSVSDKLPVVTPIYKTEGGQKELVRIEITYTYRDNV